MVNQLSKRQIEFNQASLDGWQAFTNHREIVTELLSVGARPGNSRLCILGAGNSNDVDLAHLLRSHREIHLVDLDADALARGVARQGFAEDPAVKCHGGIDVTGMWDTLAAKSPQCEIRPADLDAFIAEPFRQVGSALPGPFDVVASTCLLSQLIDAVSDTLGQGHPRFLEVVQAIRAGHLHLLVQLVSPGGIAVLITDIVSSDSHPPLRSVAEETLFDVVAQLIADRNFFHGVNPAVLLSLFRSDPLLAREVAGVEASRPWRWNLGPRVYAVCALTARRYGIGARQGDSECE